MANYYLKKTYSGCMIYLCQLSGVWCWVSEEATLAIRPGEEEQMMRKYQQEIDILKVAHFIKCTTSLKDRKQLEIGVSVFLVRWLIANPDYRMISRSVFLTKRYAQVVNRNAQCTFEFCILKCLKYTLMKPAGRSVLLCLVSFPNFSIMPRCHFWVKIQLRFVIMSTLLRILPLLGCCELILLLQPFKIITN